MGVRQEILACAKAYLGVPYKSIYGGTGPEDGGFTCSGLTWRAYHDAGIEIPIAQGIHSYYTGSYNGWETQAGWTLNNGHFTDDADRLKVGDLVFYSPVWDMERTGHVAIYAGDGMVIHANGAPVSIDPLSAGGNFVGGGWPLVELPEDEGPLLMSAKGTVRFLFNMNIRSLPSVDSAKRGDLSKGETRNIDGMTLAGGYAWGHYVGSNSGKDCYIALAGEGRQYAEVVE